MPQRRPRIAKVKKQKNEKKAMLISLSLGTPYPISLQYWLWLRGNVRS